MEAIFIIFCIVILTVNYQLVDVYNYISKELYDGRSLAPRETTFYP